jgi:hypothetical protein
MMNFDGSYIVAVYYTRGDFRTGPSPRALNSELACNEFLSALIIKITTL